MKNHIDPLMSVFAELESKGWTVDYLEKAGSVHVGPVPRRTEVICTFGLIPEEAALGIRFDVQTQYHFKKHAKQFLELLGSKLGESGFDLSWHEPQSFRIKWQVKRPSFHLVTNPSDFRRELRKQVFEGHRLVLAFAHALKTCARQAKKRKTKRFPKLLPAHLVVFAIAETMETLSLH